MNTENNQVIEQEIPAEQEQPEEKEKTAEEKQPGKEEKPAAAQAGRMKNLIWAAAILCLVFAVLAGSGILRAPQAAVPETAPASFTASPAEENSQNSADAIVGQPMQESQDTDTEDVPEVVAGEAAETKSGRLDFDAMYALHDGQEKVLTIGDKEESWRDYFYLLYTQCGQIEDYFDTLASYYGIVYRWDEAVDEEGSETFAQMASENTENIMVQLAAVEALAEDCGVEYDEALIEKVEKQKQEDLVQAMGEDGKWEDFLSYLEEIYLDEEMYERLTLQNFLYQESFKTLYGEKGELLPAEEAVKYLEDNGYVSAAHILLRTKSQETGEDLSEEEKAEKKQQLEDLVSELRAVEDNQARKEAFLQAMNELSEDPGSTRYPEGYTYLPGTMVEEFETAAAALEDYGISDVTETSYGYHILLRLPLDADRVVEFNQTTGEPRTGRMLAANQAYSQKLQEKADTLELKWLPGYEAPDLLEYVKK